MKLKVIREMVDYSRRICLYELNNPNVVTNILEDTGWVQERRPFERELAERILNTH